MSQNVYVYDPTAADDLSRVRGIGRYMQLLQENFPEWKFSSKLTIQQFTNDSIFINPFINFLQRPVTTKRIAKKQIAVIHDLILLKYPTHFPAGIKGSLNIFTNKLALKNYDVIVTDSEASKKDIVKILGIPDKEIKVIYPTLPKIFNLESRIHNSEFLTLKSKFCLYVGDVTWNKNLANVAKAIKTADVHCVFVGKAFTSLRHPEPLDIISNDSPSSPTRSGIQKISLDSRLRGNDNKGHQNDKGGWLSEFNEFSKLAKDDPHFIFPGFVTDEELIMLYQNAQANLLVSRDEGFGFSYIEAVSQGCPSILSDIPVFRETAKDSALFVNPEKPEEIAEKIQVLFHDKEKRSVLQKRGKKRLTDFSTEQFKKNFSAIIS